MTYFKNPTVWRAPSGVGYFNDNGSVDLLTVSGVKLTTVSGIDLITAPETYKPKADTLWTKATKNDTQWRPTSGYGYVNDNGGLNLVTNLGAYIVDNLGNYILTNPTTEVGKSKTLWTETG